MSATSSSSSSSTVESGTSTATISGIFSGPSGGVSSSLYLFTFLITIVVLGVISAGLLLRAYYVRRQFQLRVEEAIRRGQPLPQDAVRALGLDRPKKGKDFGPMPSMWEVELKRDDEKVEWRDETDWRGIKPLAMVHFPTHEAPPPPPDYPATNQMPQRRGPFFLRPFLSPRYPDGLPTSDPSRPNARRLDTFGSTIQENEPAFEAPGDGAEVTVGVMIALPVEEGKGAEKWSVEEEEEAEVPEVCLGVMECRVRARE